MTRRLVALILVVLSACDGVASDDALVEEKTTGASPLTQVRRPDTLRELVQVGNPKLAATLDEATAKKLQAELTAHRAAFTFTQAPLIKPDPGTPSTRSFIEDDWTLHLSAAAKLPAYAPACVLDPCVLRLDLDGAGTKDAVISAWDKTTQRYSVAVQSNRWTLVGVPLDLGKARWRSVSASELSVSGFTRQGVLLETKTTGTPTRYLLFQDALGARVVRL